MSDMETDDGTNASTSSAGTSQSKPAASEAAAVTVQSKREVGDTGAKPKVVAGPSTASGSPKRGQSRSQKAKRAKNREEEGKKVILALYPHQDQQSNFRRRCGADIDPTRLLASTKFRDLWKEFSEEKQPAASLRSKLKDEAVRIMSKPLASDKGEPTKNSKRSREEVSSNTLSSTPTGKPYKVPKNQKAPTPIAGPSTASPSATATVSSATATVNAEPVEGSFQGEYPNNAEFDPDGEDRTYAATAAGNRSEAAESPHSLYIHASKDDKLLMPRQTWLVFLEKFHGKCLECLATGKAKPPRVELTGFKNGIGLIVPRDEESQATIVQLVDKISVVDTEFKAWKKGEKGTWTPLTIQVPAQMSPSQFTQGMLVTSLITLNELPAGGQGDPSIKGHSCKVIPGTSGKRLLRFLVKPDVLEEIVNLNGYLYAGAAKLKVFHNLRPITDFTKEELGLQSAAAQP
jgi:hypothetical protein